MSPDQYIPRSLINDLFDNQGQDVVRMEIQHKNSNAEYDRITLNQQSSLKKSSNKPRRYLQRKRKRGQSLGDGQVGNGRVPKQNKEGDINKQIQMGEVAQWAYKNTRSIDDFEFTKEENQEHSDRKSQATKRIEKKLTEGYQKSNTGGLLAKAQELQNRNYIIDKKTQKIVKQNHIKVILQQQVEQSIMSAITNKSDLKMQSISTLLKTPAQEIKQQAEQEQEDKKWQKINQETKKEKSKQKQQVMITHNEMIQKYLQKKPKIPTKQPQQPFLNRLCGCFRIGNRYPKNQEYIELFRIIAQLPLQNKPEEIFLLKNIYTQLTSEQYSRYGQHWTKIGFQGNDPATDLRSVGMLSLLQWYLFIIHFPQYANKVYLWSIQNQFPLALTHIKTTALWLQQLKKHAFLAQWNGSMDGPMEYYASYVVEIFQSIMKQYSIGDEIGNIVQRYTSNINTKLAYKKYKLLLKQIQNNTSQ